MKPRVTENAHCAPSRQRIYERTETCFKYDELRAIAAKINRVQRAGLPTSGSKGAIWTAIQRYFSENYQCDSEACWKVPKSLEAKSLRPKAPSAWQRNPETWLSNEDIEHALKPYQEAHREFMFVGVFPIDFASRFGFLFPVEARSADQCVSPTMCSLQVKNLQRRSVRTLGFVFNLDKHHQPGSHWVSLVMGIDPSDPNRYGAFYYDSVGIKPPAEIHAFVNKVREQLGDPGYRFAWNTKQHQKKNSECGVYSVTFIHMCLENGGQCYSKIAGTRITDEEANRLRSLFWRH